MKELINIQSALNVPKTQRNEFGKYNYRSCEDILEAVKPLLLENNCFLFISDSLSEINGKVYITAKATIKNLEGQEISVTASAREEDTKKGMDSAQITGSTSSYARKYALNGLFCIDDAKDIDGDKPEKEKPKEEILSDQKRILLDKTAKDIKLLNNILTRYNKPSMSELTDDMITETYDAMKQKGLVE
ncbi:ERF family protein [Dysgonomonas sp.]|uniref:ERF family protein n=1 Tax=Dysgonomonas sp. TaxID=1891233 RepID=UPI0027B8BC62|nr:ERF family protein [Dysgonomonas sp.]